MPPNPLYLGPLIFISYNIEHWCMFYIGSYLITQNKTKQKLPEGLLLFPFYRFGK